MKNLLELLSLKKNRIYVIENIANAHLENIAKGSLITGLKTFGRGGFIGGLFGLTYSALTGERDLIRSSIFAGAIIDCFQESLRTLYLYYLYYSDYERYRGYKG